MPEPSAYCKAIYVKDLRALDGWEENLENLRPDTKEEDGKEVEIPRTELTDEDFLYLHDSYIVTDDVYKDTHIIFDKVTDLWKEQCHSKLGFEIPSYEPITIETAADDSAAASDSEDDSSEAGA